MKSVHPKLSPDTTNICYKLAVPPTIEMLHHGNFHPYVVFKEKDTWEETKLTLISNLTEGLPTKLSLGAHIRSTIRESKGKLSHLLRLNALNFH